jgi:hypothetical protein
MWAEHSKYIALPVQVSVTALPPGVSLTTADTILFIGKAVRVLKQPVVAAAAAARSGQALQASSELLSFCDALHELQQREEFRYLYLCQGLCGCLHLPVGLHHHRLHSVSILSWLKPAT